MMKFGDSQTMSQCSSEKGDKNQKRRTWTDAEELCLLAVCRELVAQGWKCDNGFKNGFLTACQTAMAKKFPGCDLKGSPHIHSKLTVWKKNYSSLTSMLSRSGIGWNSTSYTIDVGDENAWEDYVKFDTKARTMRGKQWPFFDEWSIIFGKDRAVGDRGASFIEAINKVVSGNSGPELSPPQEHTADNVEPTQDVDTTSISGGGSSSAQKGKRKRGGSRTQATFAEDSKMVEMMSNFFSEMHIQMGTLISKVGYQHDAAVARRGVFDALEQLEYLSVDQKLDAAKAICMKQEYVDIFYGLSMENKAAMVERILQKTW